MYTGWRIKLGVIRFAMSLFASYNSYFYRPSDTIIDSPWVLTKELYSIFHMHTEKDRLANSC